MVALPEEGLPCVVGRGEAFGSELLPPFAAEALCSCFRSVSGVEEADPEDGMEARLDSRLWWW